MCNDNHFNSHVDPGKIIMIVRKASETNITQMAMMIETGMTEIKRISTSTSMTKIKIKIKTRKMRIKII